MSTRTGRITAIVIAVVVVAAGCTASAKPVTVGPGPTASSDTTTGTSDAADRKNALAAYSGMVTAWVGMLDSGDLDPELTLYTDGNVNSKIRGELNKMNLGGLIYKGTPKSAPTIKAIDLTANPPTATINDCLDSRNWTPFINKGTDKGKSALAPGQTLVPHPLVATLTKDPYRTDQPKTGGWVVTDFTIYTDQKC